MLLGVDIGGTKCALILAENDGTIVSRTATATADIHTTLNWILNGAKALAQKNPIVSVGVSCGGPLDSGTGEILSPPNLPGWDAIPITELLTEATGAPAFLCNDANACALAEWKFGAGQGSRNMIFLTFGTGMGAGLILDGRLYEGTNGMAGEAGHIRLSDSGPVGYGKAGSFEGFCSGGGIARLGALMGVNGTAKEISERAKAGDEAAKAVYKESARRLGAGLSVLIDLFNPDCIVIGSVFARSEVLFREEMEAVIAKEALPEAASVCKIVPAALGDAIGDHAAVAVAQRGWEDSHV